MRGLKIQKKVVLKSGNIIEPDFILLALGREPIKVENTDCKILGDACGEIQLAHYAIRQALNYVEGLDTTLNKNLIPSVIYGEPEIAWVGLRDQDCNESYQKTILPITALGKSWCDDSTEGFIKIISKNDDIVGAHVVSKEASALVQQILIAMQVGVKIQELKKVCFAHPTFSEGIFEAIQRI